MELKEKVSEMIAELKEAERLLNLYDPSELDEDYIRNLDEAYDLITDVIK